MIRYDGALKILDQAARERAPLPAETVPLASAAGRVAAQDIAGRDALPPFDNSAMDGYAVRARDTASASPSSPARLPVTGSTSAGDPPAEPSRAHGAWEIMTGAPVPAGFDSIVKIEAARVLDAGRSIELTAPVREGEHVRLKGSDYAPGLTVIRAGEELDARHALALAALGIDTVPVRRKPRIALISTGRELVEPGEAPRPGQIRNATASYLLAVLPLLGADVRFHGTSPDDPADFRRRAEKALAEDPDILLTTGAVSMGKHDFVTAAAVTLGAEILYHKVAIRPGKPGLVGRFSNGALFFGMPGNPISTVVGVRFFLVPVLRRLLGLPTELPVRMRLEADAAKPEGLRCFFKARAAVTQQPSVRILKGQASFQIQPLLEANAWAVLSEEGDRVPAGTEVEVYPILPQAAGWAAPSDHPQPAFAASGCC